MHCHVFVPMVNQKAAERPEFQAELAGFAGDMGQASVEHNRDVMMPQALDRLINVETRLADMDAAGVAIQCLSPSPSQYFYWADEELSCELVALQNMAISELCEQYPERFVGLGAVSLQHPQLAVEQLRVLMQLPGMKGVEIATRIAGLDLDHPDLLPFWQAAEALGALVFIHPFTSHVDDRLQDWYLSNLIGQPLESTIALSRLIFSGLFEQHRNLRVLAAHGGGYLPQYCGRIDKGALVRPESGGLPRLPSDYLKTNLWFDSLVFSPLSLRHLIDQVGAERVVLGTDYPFDMGSEMNQPWLASLSADERRALLRDNAVRLLQLPAEAIPEFSDFCKSQPTSVAGQGKELL
nr:amidohydrolase family protein [Oceanobacter mangrovi]